MVSEPHNWTVPAPLRALLWWPPLAFVLVMLEPSAAPVTIAAAGAVLAVLGVVGSAVGRAITRRRSLSEVAEAAATPIAERAVPVVVEQRAA